MKLKKKSSYKKRRRKRKPSEALNEAQKMSTVIFSLSFLILLALIAYAARSLRRERHSFFPAAERQNQLESARFAGLFAPTARDLARFEQEKHQRQFAEQREKLLTWATLVDFSALNNRPIFKDEKLFAKSWEDAVEILTGRTRSVQDVRLLTSFCLDNEINVNASLVNSFHKIWAESPDAKTTVEMFRLVANVNDAELFLDVLIEAEQFVKTQKLSEISAAELSELAESHYWLLSQQTRTSGAGFLVKQKMTDMRSEWTQR